MISDNVFKTMKSKHKRLFISVINDTLGKNYPMNAEVEVLPLEGYLTENETADGYKDIEEKISDFVIKIGDEIFRTFRSILLDMKRKLHQKAI